MYLLYLLEYLNLVIAFFTVAVGIKSLKKLNENRILVFIPILSVLQTILSELLGIWKPKSGASITTLNLINIYICAEFFLICLFFWALSQGRKRKAFVLVTIILATISIFTSNYNLHVKKQFELDIFILIEGPIILTTALLLIFDSIKKKNIVKYSSEANLIATLGIFFSFIISWPTLIVQNSFTNPNSPFFKLYFIFNSIAYLIFFSFLSYSFYVSRKSRII